MAVTYTYSSDTNTIHVTGGNSTSPATFNAMYIADTSNTWNKVREVVANCVYVLSSNVHVGDGTNSTYFTTSGEAVHFIDGCVPVVDNNATLKIGHMNTTANQNWPLYPSWVRVRPTSDWTLIDASKSTANFLMYCSTIFAIPSSTFHTYIKDGTVTLWGSMWQGGYSANSSNVIFDTGIDTLIIRDAVFYNVNRVQLDQTGGSQDISGVFLTHGGDGAITTNANNLIFTEVDFSSGAANNKDIKHLGSAGIYFTNPTQNLNSSTIYIEQANAEVYERYSFDVYVSDQNGNSLTGVNVKLFKVDDKVNAEISADTAANGTITSNTAIYRKWVGTGSSGGSTLVEYGPYTIVLSKNGYRTVTIKNLALNKISNFRFEMADDSGQTIGSDIIISMN
jgi:hypothetical protein